MGRDVCFAVMLQGVRAKLGFQVLSWCEQNGSYWLRHAAYFELLFVVICTNLL